MRLGSNNPLVLRLHLSGRQEETEAIFLVDTGSRITILDRSFPKPHPALHCFNLQFIAPFEAGHGTKDSHFARKEKRILDQPSVDSVDPG